MGIQLNTGFSLKSKAFLDERDSFESLSAMKNYSETNLPDGFTTYNKEDGLYYVYNSANDIDVNLGRWREYSGGSTVIKKTDIKTTLDENSTNDDVCGGKAIFEALKANAIGKETALYEGRISATGTYTLADNVNNYDFIIINHRQESGVNCQSTTLSKYEISKCSDYEHKFMCVLGYGSSEDCTSGYFNNDKLILSSYNFQTITSITGYKFGEVTVQNTITNPLQPISYSTDEQLTGGTWIDGKPIYRKVVNKTFSITSGGSWCDIGITISDIDKLIRTSVIRVEDCANLNDVLFNVASSKIFALRESALNSSNFDVILEYTKTTDV